MTLEPVVLKEPLLVTTGTLLLLSVLIPNLSSFVERGREFMRRRELGAARGARAREAAS